MPFLVPGSTGVREAYIISWVSPCSQFSARSSPVVSTIKSSATPASRSERGRRHLVGARALGLGRRQGPVGRHAGDAREAPSLRHRDRLRYPRNHRRHDGRAAPRVTQLDHIRVLLGLAVPSVLIFARSASSRSCSATKRRVVAEGRRVPLWARLLGVAIGAALHDIPSMWWFDGAVALSVAVALGSPYTLWKNARQSNAWWTVKFWRRRRWREPPPPSTRRRLSRPRGRR